MRIINFVKILLLSTFSFLSFSISVAQDNKAIESISKDEIKNHMYFLASDYLNGRVSYEPGYNIAAEYCSSQFKSIGLKPVFKDKENKPSFYQGVPLVVKSFSEKITVDLVDKNSTINLKHMDDFKIPVMMSDYVKGEVEMVFVGYGITEDSHNWNDLKGLDIKNKAIVMLMDAPIKKGQPVLPEEIHKSYLSFKGFEKKIMNLAKYNPSSIIIISDQKFLKSVPWEYLPTLKEGENCYYDGENSSLAISIPPVFVVKPEVTDHIFKNSNYSPKNISYEGIKGYKTFHINNLKIKMDFEVLSEKKIISNNVIGIVEGTDPILKNEFITIGAHLDHLPDIDGKIYNGADDNASGSIGVLESAEAMALTPPKRSVLFILYTAEELGLYGSSHFVNNLPFDINQIKFNINLDMIGRSIPKNKAKKTHRVVIYDEYFNKIKQFVEDNNEKTIQWSLDFISAKDKSGDSDHTSYHKKGIPSFQFASGHHKDYHKHTDDSDAIDFEKLQKITQLTYILAYKLANKENLNFK